MNLFAHQLLDTPFNFRARCHADPVANFLFERKQGHCEYFASSMHYAAHLSIPSRVVKRLSTGSLTTSPRNTWFAPAMRTPGWKLIFWLWMDQF